MFTPILESMGIANVYCRIQTLETSNSIDVGGLEDDYCCYVISDYPIDGISLSAHRVVACGELTMVKKPSVMF